MTTSFNHVLPWIFVGPFLMALAACPQNNKQGTTDDPENEDTTSSGAPSTTTGETTAPSEPDTTSTTTLDPDTSSTSTTAVDPDTTGGDACPVDLAASLVLNYDQCNESLVLIFTVHNVGTVDVPAGIDVTFYEGTDASGLKLGTKPTLEPLFAGSSTEVVWVLDAPPAGESRDYYVEVDRGPSIVECDENNNSALVTNAACPD